MKKTLTIIAVAVMLLTVFAFVLFTIDICGSNPEAWSKGDGIALYIGMIFLGFMLITESTLFGGIALLLSKKRTLLKIILGIVIVIISLYYLIGVGIYFFGLWLK